MRKKFIGKLGTACRSGPERSGWCSDHLAGALQALDMGLINTVVPLERLEEETLVWCREILKNSPTALRVLKAALNAAVCNLLDLLVQYIPCCTDVLSLLLCFMCF